MMMSAGWSLACSRASCSLLTKVMLSPARFADSLILTVKNKSSSTARTFLGSSIEVKVSF